MWIGSTILKYLIRVYLYPRVLFHLIAIWYFAPNAGRLIKDFLLDNIHVTAFLYGLLTAFAVIYGLSTHDASFVLMCIITSFTFLLTYPLILVIFCRVRYRNSSRVNWRKTLAPATDPFIIWFVTVVFSCLIYLFIVLISKK